VAAARILLVEDDLAISEPLERALNRENYQVTAVRDGPSGLREGLSENYDLVLLDIGLPVINGLEICRQVKGRFPQRQIIMLTARTEEIDAVVGLDSGADDYVGKPFRLAELLARVRTALRRTESSTLLAPGLRIEPASRRAFLSAGGDVERELTLSVKEFDLLVALVRRAGQVVTREELFREVWHTSWVGSTKTLDQHISWLRAKLDDSATDPRYITTVRGIGFRFAGTDTPAPGSQ
jgi:DNA-binding response OmpR family regulator